VPLAMPIFVANRCERGFPVQPGCAWVMVSREGDQTNSNEDDPMQGHQLTQAVTEREAARILGLSVATLRAWRLKSRGPRFVRFGRSVRYLESDIAQYMDACAVVPGLDRRASMR
jgi:excisionase family DNA binding protein